MHIPAVILALTMAKLGDPPHTDLVIKQGISSSVEDWSE
jgi:hypothetical protein